jgi:2-polyprenyl-3-methyl-5-hydroxy-6-metoxy-1,4-benzoquinol methylase
MKNSGLIEECLCGCRQWVYVKGRKGMSTMACAGCGIMAQRVEMSLEDVGDWYREKYQKGIYTHDLEHDREVARKRIKTYGSKLTGRILDVGCGNGAFVLEVRDLDLDCEGQDFFSPLDREWIHQGDLFELNFPTEHYDVITCHDVLEHVPDLLGFLKEIRRMLKPGGWFILDFPDFDFDHHWKKVEHIWLLNREQVRRVLIKAGFTPAYFHRPIESKLVFYSSKPEEVRKSILLPPGIGDSYWSVVKLPGMIEELGLGMVDLVVSDPDNKQRSLEWIRKLPWANAKGYVEHKVTAPAFNEAYMQNGRYLFEDVEGCDYFLAFNGVMRFGADLDQVEEGWGSEWFPRMFHSSAEKKAEREYRERFGRFVIAYFVEHGMYRQWLDRMNPLTIANLLKRIKGEGYEVVFMGAEWDKKCLHSQLAMEIGGVDLAGETSLDQMFGLIRASSGVIGWPAGNTIMATVLRKQTLLWWSGYFDKRFWSFSCPPESRGDWYHHGDTARFQMSQVDQFLERI